VLLQVGPGVKDLFEGDVVLPTTPLLGTFTQAAVVKAKQLVRVGKVASLDSSSAGATHSQGECTGWGCAAVG
jgi:NADPH:quinone reductase-like Zn-dependent oxidoreductase